MTIAIEAWREKNKDKLRQDQLAIVGTGISGQAITWPISMALQIPVVIVRKPEDKNHGRLIEGKGQLLDYIMIDDCISTGDTIRRVVKTINEEYTREVLQLRAVPNEVRTDKPELKAVFLYSSNYNKTFDLYEPGVDDYQTVPVYGTQNLYKQDGVIYRKPSLLSSGNERAGVFNVD